MDDKLIRFPGAQAAATPEPPAPARGKAGALTPEQEKAIGIILGGMSFVCIGVQPTDSGADFFTAVQGDAQALREAQPHLDGVIARAYRRQGIG